MNFEHMPELKWLSVTRFALGFDGDLGHSSVRVFQAAQMALNMPQMAPPLNRRVIKSSLQNSM